MKQLSLQKKIFFLYNIRIYSITFNVFDRSCTKIIEKIPGTYKSEGLNNFTGIDKILSKCDCVNGSIVDGVREPVLCSFALDKPPGPNIFEEPGIKLFTRKNKIVFSHIKYFLEDDEYKLVDFNGEAISFTCQLVKI